MKKETRKTTLALCLIATCALIGWKGQQEQSNATVTSTVALANIEALANSESSDCRFKTVHKDPYSGNCYCVGTGNLCCQGDKENVEGEIDMDGYLNVVQVKGNSFYALFYPHFADDAST